MSLTPQPAQPFDPNASHMQRPCLRAVRGFQAQNGQQVMLGLSDARQISDRVVFVPPAFQAVLPLMDGSRTLDEIVSSVGRGLSRGVLEPVVAQLDSAGLLVGPSFDAMLAKMRADFDSAEVLPPASTAAMVEQLGAEGAEEGEDEAARDARGVKRLAEVMDQWIAAALKDVPNPSFDSLPKAVVAPHIDYPRGWMNYAHVWGRMRVADRPDRVVILGTNHFGDATGVCGCDKGFSTPVGSCELDRELVGELRARLGEKAGAMFEHRFDHEREHSIELQIPWIQHCLGKDEKGEYCKVLGVLVHDPSVNNGESYDGKGVGLEEFLVAMRGAMDAVGGRTLVVSSADLSHVGPAFGDGESMAGEGEEADARRGRVFSHDKEMLDLYAAGKLDEMVAAMAWQQNPTRWCSLGNMVAAMRLVGAGGATMLNYAGAMDQQGIGLVTHCAAAIS